MLIGKYFKKIHPKYKSHYFSGLSFNSLSCRKNYIFFAIKGTPFNTAGWTSVEVAGKIIEKIGPILATKYIEN